MRPAAPPRASSRSSSRSASSTAPRCAMVARGSPADNAAHQGRGRRPVFSPRPAGNGGDVVGVTFTRLDFAGAGERLELTHRASDRAVFAQGPSGPQVGLGRELQSRASTTCRTCWVSPENCGMIISIEGTLTESGLARAVVEVGGFGYEVNIPATTAERLPQTGTRLKLHTLVIYREDAQTLYGFATADDRDFFRLMIENVTGIGPKGALSIMSRLSLPLLVGAIRAGDIATLSKAPGIGKKTAERLVVELKGRVGGASGAAPVSPAQRRRGKPACRRRRGPRGAGLQDWRCGRRGAAGGACARCVGNDRIPRQEGPRLGPGVSAGTGRPPSRRAPGNRPVPARRSGPPP